MRFLRFCSAFLLEKVLVVMSGQSGSLSKSSRRRLAMKRQIVERVLDCEAAWDCLIGEDDLAGLIPGGGMLRLPEPCGMIHAAGDAQDLE
jgi:hypothetical protein